VLLDWNLHPTRADRFEARIRLTTCLMHACGGTAVDLVILSDAPPHLTRRVMTEGAQIACTDPDLDHELGRAPHVLGRQHFGSSLIRQVQEVRFDNIEV